MENTKEINYRMALLKPDCADNWLTEIEIEFEKVSILTIPPTLVDITLIFPVTERPSRPRRFDLYVDMNPGAPITTRAWRRLPPSPGPPPNRPLPPLPASASSMSLPASLPSSNTIRRSKTEVTSTSGQWGSLKLRDRFRLGRRSAVVQV
ncbi:hypothetical protein DFP73DRAFT_534716 [Morchella snyderi]|nr:hypothetical protein DFP73DRAFT_534716 [Morchella snyderi]